MISLLLTLFIALSILQPLAFKVVSAKQDHSTGPLFMAFWMVMGLLVALPFFHDLLLAIDAPWWVFALMIVKGGILWLMFRDSMALAKQSLSTVSYTRPSSLGVIAVINSFLGEVLSHTQWIAALGLCICAIAFSLRGHVQDLSRDGRFLYMKLVTTIIVLSIMDQVILTHVNWYLFLWVSNAVLFALCFLKKRSLAQWLGIVASPSAVLAGTAFSVMELLKFYLMLSVIPVSVMVGIQSAVIPLTLLASALIWKERSWQEQLLWGGLSTLFMLLLLL